MKRNLNDKTKIFDVIIPHRWSLDKGINFYIRLIEKMPDINFCIFGPSYNERLLDKDLAYLYKLLKSMDNVTILERQRRNSYLKTLKKAKVVVAAAQQETFGYSFRDAMASGCIPVLANRLCYPEFVSKKYLFNNLSYVS